MISEYKLSKFKCRICKYYYDGDSYLDCDAPLDDEQIERFMCAPMGGDDPVCPCFVEVPDVD